MYGLEESMRTIIAYALIAVIVFSIFALTYGRILYARLWLKMYFVHRMRKDRNLRLRDIRRELTGFKRTPWQLNLLVKRKFTFSNGWSQEAFLKKFINMHGDAIYRMAGR